MVGGGGGIPPGDQVIIQMPFGIYVSSGTVEAVETVTNNVGDDETIVTIGDTYDSNGYDTSFATNTLTGAGFNFFDGFDLGIDLGYQNLLGNTSFLLEI